VQLAAAEAAEAVERSAAERLAETEAATAAARKAVDIATAARIADAERKSAALIAAAQAAADEKLAAAEKIIAARLEAAERAAQKAAQAVEEAARTAEARVLASIAKSRSVIARPLSVDAALSPTSRRAAVLHKLNKYEADYVADAWEDWLSDNPGADKTSAAWLAEKDQVLKDFEPIRAQMLAEMDGTAGSYRVSCPSQGHTCEAKSERATEEKDSRAAKAPKGASSRFYFYHSRTARKEGSTSRGS